MKDIDGKQKAIFASVPAGDRKTGPIDYMARLVQDISIEIMAMNPQHSVAIGNLVNDVHLPGFYVDAKLGTIEFDWTDFLSIFFAEEALFRRILSQLVIIRSCDYLPLSALTIATQEFNAANNPPSNPKSSPTPTHTTLSEEDQQCLRKYYKNLKIPSHHGFTPLGLAKVAARHIRFIHRHAAVLGRPLVVDQWYVTQDRFPQIQNILCRELIEEETAEAEAEAKSRIEATAENGSSKPGADKVRQSRLEDFNLYIDAGRLRYGRKVAEQG